jgi:hypothetical protein
MVAAAAAIPVFDVMAVCRAACAVCICVWRDWSAVASVVKIVVAVACCALVRSSSVVKRATILAAICAGVGGVGGVAVLVVCPHRNDAASADSSTVWRIDRFIKGNAPS